MIHQDLQKIALATLPDTEIVRMTLIISLIYNDMIKTFSNVNEHVQDFKNIS